MRGVSRGELIRFLFDRFGLRGPLWEPANAPAAAADLGMFQIDWIRVTGLRNHDLAWIAPATRRWRRFPMPFTRMACSANRTFPCLPFAATGCRC